MSDQPETPRDGGSDLVELLRQRIRAAGETYSGPNRERFKGQRGNVAALDAALDYLDAALMDADGNTRHDPATQAVACALLGLDGQEAEWCVFWGGPSPNDCLEVLIRPDQEDAESLAAVLDLSAGGGIASRPVSTVRGGPWRVETPGGES